MSEPSERPFPGSLCHLCAKVRRVPGKRSVFLMCSEPGLPKYPPQPVRRCAAWQAVPEGSPPLDGTA